LSVGCALVVVVVDVVPVVLVTPVAPVDPDTTTFEFVCAATHCVCC
jgi:hypothetical protein